MKAKVCTLYSAVCTEKVLSIQRALQKFIWWASGWVDNNLGIIIIRPYINI